jgi:hemerythrin superfamily protein
MRSRASLACKLLTGAAPFTLEENAVSEVNPSLSIKSEAAASKGRSAPDAVAMLKAEHAAVDELFRRFEKSRKAEVKQKLADEICRELAIHTTIEEEILYPALREALDEADLLDEADVEHAGAKDLIAKIRAGSAGDSHWDAMVIVLGEYIRHHVKEEHKEMFPKAKASAVDLKSLGARMAARRAELEQR